MADPRVINLAHRSVYYGRYDSEKGWVDRVKDKATGISMRFIREYDLTTDQQPARLDVEIIKLSVKPRWRRLVNLPVNAFRLHRIGVSWRHALGMAWSWVWLG